jgi:hypothetical protein
VREDGDQQHPGRRGAREEQALHEPRGEEGEIWPAFLERYLGRRDEQPSPGGERRDAAPDQHVERDVVKAAVFGDADAALTPSEPRVPADDM